jgi:hypothetical protein
VPCISSDRKNILTMPTHDLRDTRDKRVNAHPPQPIGFTFLTLTCSSAGCCFHRARRSSPPACSRRFEMRSMKIKRRPRCTTLLGSAPLRLACLEYVGRLSVASNGSRWLDVHQTRKKKYPGQVKVNRFPPPFRPTYKCTRSSGAKVHGAAG